MQHPAPTQRRPGCPWMGAVALELRDGGFRVGHVTDEQERLGDVGAELEDARLAHPERRLRRRQSSQPAGGDVQRAARDECDEALRSDPHTSAPPRSVTLLTRWALPSRATSTPHPVAPGCGHGSHRPRHRLRSPQALIADGVGIAASALTRRRSRSGRGQTGSAADPAGRGQARAAVRLRAGPAIRRPLVRPVPRRRQEPELPAMRRVLTLTPRSGPSSRRPPAASRQPGHAAVAAVAIALDNAKAIASHQPAGWAGGLFP